jgi:hypothetical protein
MQAVKTLAGGRYRRPLLTVEVPGEEPIRGATVLIANTHPWSYMGKRPLHVADRATFDGGLDMVIPNDFRRRHAMRLFRYAILTGKHVDVQLIDIMKFDDGGSVRPASGLTTVPPHTPTPVLSRAFRKL